MKPNHYWYLQRKLYVACCPTVATKMCPSKFAEIFEEAIYIHCSNVGIRRDLCDGLQALFIFLVWA